jgi:1,4-alpha-glucan branching enzyme
MVKTTKRGSKVWVTFTVPAGDYESVHLKGSWDGWETREMKVKKNGEFYTTRVVPAGERYEFGYITDSNGWMTDESLPTVGTPFGSLNSVLEL